MTAEPVETGAAGIATIATIATVASRYVREGRLQRAWRPWRRWSEATRERALGWLLLLPALVLVFGLILYPVLYDVALALSDAQGFGGPERFAGLANFRTVLGSREFRTAALNSALYTAATASARVVLGVAMALVLWRLRRARAVVFLALFVPWVFPAALSAFAFYWLLSPPFHTFYTLFVLRLRFALADLLGQDLWHVGAIAAHDVWRSSAFLAIFLLAGLNSLPADQLEYAALECGGWRRFRYVVLPMVRRFLVLALLLSLVLSFIDYTNIYLQTGGRITWPLVGTLAYRASFFDGNTALGAAMTLVQLPIWFAVLWAGFRLFEREPRAPVALERAAPRPAGAPPSAWDPPPRPQLDSGADALAARAAAAAARRRLPPPAPSSAAGPAAPAPVAARARPGSPPGFLRRHWSEARDRGPQARHRAEGLGRAEGRDRRRPTRATRLRARDVWTSVQLGLAAALIAVFALFPVWWIVLQAVRPLHEDRYGNPFWTWAPTLDGFLEAFEGRHVWIWLLNTGIVLVVGLALTLVAGVLAGYALARLRVPGRRWIARLLLASYFLPQPMVLVPIYQVFLALHLDNTLASVILLNQTLTIPFAAWLCYTYFEGLPPDVEEHAALDASRWQRFRWIVLPMSWPVVIAAGIFGAGVMLSDFVYAGLLLVHNDVKTIAVGLGIIGISLDEFNSITGGIGIAATPLVVACAAFAPAYVRGLSAAMVEGA